MYETLQRKVWMRKMNEKCFPLPQQLLYAFDAPIYIILPSLAMGTIKALLKTFLGTILHVELPSFKSNQG